MSIFVLIRDTLIAMALSWVGVSLEARTEAPQSAADCASTALDCAAPQN